MLRRGEDYRELGSDYFDRKNKPKVVNRLVQRLTRLGFYVNPQEAPAATPELEPEAPPVSAAAAIGPIRIGFVPAAEAS